MFDLSFASISRIHLSDNKRQDLNSAVVFLLWSSNQCNADSYATPSDSLLLHT